MNVSNYNSKSSEISTTGNSIFASNEVHNLNVSKIFAYNANNVTMRVQNGIVFVNLTEVAKAFPDKNLTHIVNSLEISDYCEKFSKLQNCSLADLLIVTRGGNNSGTWAHQRVALRVAQKLSTEFSIWVDEKIEELLTSGVTTVSNDDEAIAYAMQVLNKRLEQAKAEKERLQFENQLQSDQLKLAAPKVKYVDEVLQSPQTYTSTQMAKELGMREAEQLHKALKENGIILNSLDNGC